MAFVKHYAPDEVIVMVQNTALSGFAAGTFVKVERAEDAFKLEVGSDGRGCKMYSSNKSGTIEVTLTQESDDNALLTSLAKADEVARGMASTSIHVIDGFGGSGATAPECWIRKLPALERGGVDAHANVTWIFETLTLELDLYGNV